MYLPCLSRNDASSKQHDVKARSHEIHQLAKALSLAVAYAANIGGIATLTGSPPNLVLKQEADE